jgi:hypothetical protein
MENSPEGGGAIERGIVMCWLVWLVGEVVEVASRKIVSD